MMYDEVAKDRESMLILQEECAEVIQAISKCFRFGSSATYNGRSNKERLEEEIGDLLCMVDILIERGIVGDTEVNAARKNKRAKLERWSGLFDGRSGTY